jgi:hypothetical protein
MSITPIGGVTPAASHITAAQAKPETAEVSGAADHDGDTDGSARAQAPAGAKFGVNVKA